MAKKQTPDPKIVALKRNGTLHRRPETVVDPLFHEDEFFDARDVLQVKYEMLRRTVVEADSISAAAAAFGFSRPAFYEAKRAFERGGLAGLIAQRPGPRRAHKLSEDVMSFVDELLEEDPSQTTPDLLSAIKDRFGIAVHRRSVERAIHRREKKTP